MDEELRTRSGGVAGNQSGVPGWMRLLFWSAFLCGFGLRLYWSFLVPYNAGPDEFCHFPMAEYLSLELRPPTMADVPSRIPVSYAALPPLGYVPAACTLALASPENPHRHRYARLGNVIVGTMLIWVAWRIGLLLFPSRPEIAVCAAWLVALHPQLVFLASYVNNDTSALLATGMLWYLWIRLAVRGPGLGLYAAIGVTAAVAFLCKTNAAGVIAAGGPILLYQLWTARRGIARELLRMALVPAAALGVAIPWIVWSYRQHGSWWGLDTCRDWWFAYLNERGIEQGFLTSANWDAFVEGTWKSFWACFGYWSVWLPPLWYQAITLVFGLGVGVLLLRRTLLRRAFAGTKGAWVFVLLSIAVGVLATGTSHVLHSLQFGFSPQGRYLTPIALPVLLGLAAAAGTLARGRFGRHFGTCLIILFFFGMQSESIDAVTGSNRVGPQETRKVKGILLSSIADLPTRYLTLPPERACNPAANQGHFRLLPGRDSIVQSSHAIRASELGWLQIQHRKLFEGLNEGRVVLRAASPEFGGYQPGLTYHVGVGSLVQLTFDLRELAAPFGNEPVYVEIHPPAGAEVEIRQFEIRNSQRKLVQSTATHKLRTPAARLQEFYISRKH